MSHALHSVLDDEGGWKLLDEVARALTEAPDFETAVRAGARCLVPRFADLVAVVAPREGGAELLEVVHADPMEEGRLAARLRQLLPDIQRVAVHDLQRGRQFRWVPRIDDGSTRFLRNEPALLQLLDGLKAHSIVVVPLRSSDRILGGVALARLGDGEPFHAADLATAQVIAKRMAAVMETAELKGRAVDEQSRRLRLETALRKWVQVFNHAAWRAAIVDGEDHRIEVVNPAFARIHGYAEPDMLIGRLFSDVLDQERMAEPARWAGGEPALHYESLHRRVDGTLFPVLPAADPSAIRPGVERGSE